MASTPYSVKMPVSQMSFAPPVASSAGWKTSRIFFMQPFSFAQTAGQLQQDRHVAVMAAGVHAAGMGRSVGRAGFFVNGQGVHIRPEGDGPLCAEVEPGAQAPVSGGEKPAAQALQLAAQVLDGQGKLAVQLGDLVQCPTVLNDPNGSCPLSVDECFSIIDDVDGCVNLYLAIL